MGVVRQGWSPKPSRTVRPLVVGRMTQTAWFNSLLWILLLMIEKPL